MTSKIKVDNINKVSDDSNIIKKCGTTITLGASGDSIALASGASQTGFGRTGTVDWQTGSIKTATFTAVNGEGYFANTAGGTFEMDLPAGSAGAIVSVQDYNNTFDSNSLTVDPNGSEKINGGTAGEVVTLNTEGRGVTFVYIDSTVGWRSVQDNDFTKAGVTPAFISGSVSGSGNTLTTVCTNFKLATFTGPGTFTVCSVGNPAGSSEVSYMVIAGAGGGGGTNNSGPYGSGGGGGAGGTREAKSNQDSYTASPLATTGFPVTAQGYAVVVGGGGAAGATDSGKGGGGSVSSVFGITSTGGGGGGGRTPGNGVGNTGGSGGGGGTQTPSSAGDNIGGAGNTPPVSPPQGNNGGFGGYGGGCAPYPSSGANGGGGGGATAVGANSAAAEGGDGGAGATSSISGTPTARGGGGGGGVYVCGSVGNSGSGAGGTGGGGPGGPGPASTSPGNGQAGTTNTGGGGGGGSTIGSVGTGRTGGAGGSGIVLIRYKFQ